MHHSDRIKKSIEKLNRKLQKGKKESGINFHDFLVKISESPQHSLRNIFQLFHDMIHFYIPVGINEYPNDPESINYIQYDCGKLFVDDTENPFFADRLLANRLINVSDSLKGGVVRNKMLLFVGPPGSGKSTFLNNLLQKLEKYTEMDVGVMYETIWQIDTEKLDFSLPSGASVEMSPSKELNFSETVPGIEASQSRYPGRFLLIPCPSHDHPIIQIPKQYREELLDEIIDDRNFKRHLFHNKEYEWVFKDTPCPVCSSIYRALSEKFSPDEIINMIFARRYEFSRKLGEGVSVYNPGDKVQKTPTINYELQKWINAIFKSSDAILYTYSRLAKTNNGIFVVMDAKVNNLERIKNLHGIISDGVHKVGSFEETINSLFLALINPEDISIINEEKSFRDRVLRIPIPYVRDYKTEAEIYRNRFGGGIERHFLPGIVTAFAKTIVSTRLNRESRGMRDWIDNPSKYEKYCDSGMLLIKMEIYTGFIPEWLSEDDVKKLDRKLRRRIIIDEGDLEGGKGISGRESIEMFNAFFNRCKNRDDLISIENLADFFNQAEYKDKIPDDFLSALERLYDYNLLQEIEESMFYYNIDQIANDIMDYLFAITLDSGTTGECPFTGRLLEINEDYLLGMERKLIRGGPSIYECVEFRNETLKNYVSKTLNEMRTGTDIKDTALYQSLVKKYYLSLKENVLSPFINNDNFRRAIKEFGTPDFKNYDKRIKDEVKLLIKNLIFKFQYTEKGAKQVCIYLIDKNLVRPASESSVDESGPAE
ncbi:MAG: hypothetical protein A2020_08710 [Lentisphaerae bacterium GWF2_45_14]|nr:MAG: hypothetical protein A2020_08710 [Lentisphaerae bacterium GWF2_45_14]